MVTNFGQASLGKWPAQLSSGLGHKEGWSPN